jgi:hypothetical protein
LHLHPQIPASPRGGAAGVAGHPLHEQDKTPPGVESTGLSAALWVLHPGVIFVCMEIVAAQRVCFSAPVTPWQNDTLEGAHKGPSLVGECEGGRRTP